MAARVEGVSKVSNSVHDDLAKMTQMLEPQLVRALFMKAKEYNDGHLEKPCSVEAFGVSSRNLTPASQKSLANGYLSPVFPLKSLCFPPSGHGYPATTHVRLRISYLHRL